MVCSRRKVAVPHLRVPDAPLGRSESCIRNPLTRVHCIDARCTTSAICSASVLSAVTAFVLRIGWLMPRCLISPSFLTMHRIHRTGSIVPIRLVTITAAA
jgi:hypothetical protein